MKTNASCGGGVTVAARLLETGNDWLSCSEVMGIRVAG